MAWSVGPMIRVGPSRLLACAPWGSAYPPSAPMMSPTQQGIFMVATCTWIVLPHTPPSEMVVLDQVWVGVLWYSCSLKALDAPVHLQSSAVLCTAASTKTGTDRNICCSCRFHAQLTPLYCLVRQNLPGQVAAATFVARERLVVGGLDESGPAITSHQGPATGGSHTICEACHVVP